MREHGFPAVFGEGLGGKEEKKIINYHPINPWVGCDGCVLTDGCPHRLRIKPGWAQDGGYIRGLVLTPEGGRSAGGGELGVGRS